MQPPAIAHRVLQPTIDIDSLVKTAKATLQPVSPTPKLLLKKPFTSPNLITALKANPKTPSPIIRSAAPDTATAAPKDMTLPQQQQIVRRQSPTPEFTTPPSSPSQIQRRESPPAVEAATKTFTTPSTLSTTTGPAAIVTNTNTNDNSNTAANIPTTTTTLTTTTSTTTTTISNPASSSSSSLANNPTPESTVADNSLAPSTQSIQLVRTHSPRSDPRLAHLSKPVNYDAIIEYKKHFAKVRLEGTLNRDGDYKIRDFMQLFKNNENQTIMRIASFIPMHVLESFLKKKVSPPALKVLPLEGGSVAISKLKGVLLGNNTAGSISHIRKPTEALMIMNQVQVDKLLDKPISTSTDKQSTGISHWPLYMVFIEGLPLRPGAVLAKLQHMPHHVDRKQLLQTYAWSKVSYLLKFPDKLHQAKQNKSNIVVYGHSENSNLLRLSIETLEIPIPASSHVMMFDRFNAEVFRKALFKHKKKGTQIWEFGSSEKSFKIEPATELFPPFSGGFITTDIKNIVHNPSIINTICDQVEKLNLTPGLTGSWKFLVPMNIFAQLKTAIRDSETSQNIQVAVANLTIGLSKNQIDAIRLWPAETSRPTHFMDQVARNFCKTRQYFIYVDDKDSVPEMERQMYPAVDFFTSKEIYKRLYTEE
ncbi:hypothetical protein BDF20DRAFT_19392 [Mycotypha africana]|uniref:uncharacterized protein n=1 Tax=Mycotypha africana TaxID=64632 RepID=UPI002300B7F6|nr:uncharacterized protein BDF20DRAFT_19392 [Mycotypha africana]KAI8991045.1 hypothetical protein BDF20DRAFT_19392 [Mycotypha africana]